MIIQNGANNKMSDIPAGTYQVEVFNVIEKISKQSGNAYPLVGFRVVSGDFINKVFSVPMAGKIVDFLKAIGEPYEVGTETDTDNWKMKRLTIHVSIVPGDKYPKYGYEEPIKAVDEVEIPF